MAGSPSRCVPRHNEQRGPEPEFAIPWNPLSTTYLKKPRKLVGAASVSISVDFRGVAQRVGLEWLWQPSTVDGTRIKAVNNKDRNFTRASLTQFIKAADANSRTIFSASTRATPPRAQQAARGSRT